MMQTLSASAVSGASTAACVGVHFGGGKRKFSLGMLSRRVGNADI